MRRDEQRQQRVHAFEDWLIEQVCVLWNLGERLETEPRRIWTEGGSQMVDHVGYRRGEQPRSHRLGGSGEGADADAYRAMLAALTETFGGAIEHVADYYFHPALRRYPTPSTAPDPVRETFLARAACAIGGQCVEHWLQERKDPPVLERALARLRYLLRDAADQPELPAHSFDRHVYPPLVHELRPWLNQSFPIGQYEAECQELLDGKWDRRDKRAGRWAYEVELYSLDRFLFAAMGYFQRVGRWSSGRYRAFVERTPDLFPRLLLGAPDPHEPETHYPDQPWLLEYSRDMVWETLTKAAENDRHDALLYRIVQEPEGARWLLQVAHVIRARGFDGKQINAEPDEEIGSALTRLLQVQALAADDDPTQIVAELQALDAETLWMLLLLSGAVQPLLFKALDIEILRPLHGWLDEIRQRLYNGEDLESGRVDVAEVEAMLAGLPEKILQRYLKAIKDSRVERDGFSKAVTVLDAVRGRNRNQLEKALVRHGQIAAKAYGLLPIEHDDDARQRYLTLQRVWKECSRYGAERQANTRAAVAVGLANLAARAGYRDAARMEWAMEAEIGDAAAERLRPVTIEAWRVQVEMAGIKPVLVVEKDGKRLKTVPAGIKKLPDFVAIRQAADELKEQAQRFRRALEQMMCDGEVLPGADLQRLLKIPAVAFLLANLLGIDGEGRIGRIDPAGPALVDGDQRWPIGDGLRIAHGLDLLEAGVLADWQRRVVAEHLVQPFKQVFRELYVPTPVEREAGTQSRRFVGHRVSGATAYRLLQGRGWSSYESIASKRYPGSGLEAQWSFPEVHHYLAEEEEVECGEIAFLRGDNELPLTEVPPLVFSETMRDADLVVAVAQIDDDGSYWSAESSRHRRELIQELASVLRLKGLRFEENFVLFSGKLADYRIHLGSGVIHIMPGSYLCIVPATSLGSGRDKLYLPFADNDRRTSEILSKILLLLNDDRIDDPSILAQIRREPA